MLTPEEQQLVKESLALYLQLAQQQMPPQMVEELAVQAKEILMKLEQGVPAEDGNNQPTGINDEWYSHVCLKCEHLVATGCDDPVTKKFPGKCDPILKFEMKKAQECI